MLDDACQIEIAPLAEPVGPARWQATCRVCGRTYPTATEDPAQHWPKHLPEGSVFAKLPPAPQPEPPFSLDCSHRGLTVRGVECATCGGKKRRLSVLTCSIYGECSLASIAGVRNCEACIRAGEHQPEGA